jgi:nitrogen-specific signal transduction histidine kinase
MGTAILLQDLRTGQLSVKDRGRRLAAVGQTVAGLAHGIKNILTGLEGGMCRKLGLKAKRSGRRGREMPRNIAKISSW